MFEQVQETITRQISAFLSQQGIPAAPIDWKWIPFAGQWGIATSFFQAASLEARQGSHIPVGERAQQIAAQVAEHLGTPEGISKVEAVRGYLNLTFSPSSFASQVIETVHREGLLFGKGQPTGKRIMVEYSQPNTHKAFHVGHLRNVVLGSAVCNILEWAGNEVIRANYIGDIGLHVIKWLWCYLKYHNGEQPPADRVRWIGEIYVQASRYYEEDPAVEPEVRALFARWDKRDPEIVALWEKTRHWSLEAFEQIYQLLGVRFDRFYFESEVEDSGKEIVKTLIEKGLARDERPEGSVYIPLDDFTGTKDKYRVLVILRSDSTSLYATKDLSLAIQKFEEYQLDRSIYIVDVRQSLYLQQIFKTLELLGYSWASQCYHLAYEIVTLPGNVTIASRDGAVVLLEDLVAEATSRALEIVQTKNPEVSLQQQAAVAHAVALGAIRYSMLSRDSSKVVTFDWESALDFNGQAAPYIQYAAVRANSILRKAGDLPGHWQVPAELQPVEITLIDLISRVPQEIQKSARDIKPLVLSTHVYDLARAFNDFYNQCPVLQADPEVRGFRLQLVAASRQAIRNLLSILGIETPDIM
ncbi:MAG TPA: arginine--tRNA ligase [Anaerolineaceae bacterium]|nr:arginine--tRNA ligase [Anaerolineaceae bacterium]